VHFHINSKNTIFYAEADIEITNVLQPTLDDSVNKENKASTSNEINISHLQKDTIDGYVSSS